MKKIALYTMMLIAAGFWGCVKDDTYPGAKLSPYIAIYDIRAMYKGQDLQLNAENMFGAHSLRCLVVSDHRAGNMPDGMLVVQDSSRLAQRGIAIPVGAAAAQYEAGDSVVIPVSGATLTKRDGIFQLAGVSAAGIQVISKNNPLPINRVTTNKIIANPEVYQSTLCMIVKGGFDPLPGPGDVLSGNKLLNDGFGDIPLLTDPESDLANVQMPVLANFRSLIWMKPGTGGDFVPELRVRKADDITTLSSTVEIAPIVITGFLADPAGSTDNNYEYIQLMATRDIDFAVTKYSLVTTNNAGASTPTGIPQNGWATGGLRTYKFNLTSGTVSKGEFFYVGCSTKLINGTGSTSISNAKWIRSFNYGSTAGDDFGQKTGNLLANSGNASGMAVFEGTVVTKESRPVDVVMVGQNGQILSEGANQIGYRITNTDWYDVINPISLASQPFFRSGTNTLSVSYVAGVFIKLGGEYSPALGRWMKARIQINTKLTTESQLVDIEGEEATKLR
ncbi:DUF5689 domain-containing protein [Chitinophaga caseinilytica]|uniref:DUF5689 domain-containing protein n=1 Tax=Chitinophaga caseinilytica TaxID=2267521 RepID=A0ABZ2Z393_9BACT